jgi:hypothetical protein
MLLIGEGVHPEGLDQKARPEGLGLKVSTRRD